MIIIAAIIIFGVLIFVHELGHFTAAKAFNIKIHEFSIGMGPAIFKRQNGEVAYSLRLLPIGGFVRMEGEDGVSDDPRAFVNQHPLKKIIVLIAGAFMNVLLGFIIFIFIFSFAGETAVPEIDKVIENSPAAIAGLMPGDRITSINGSSVHIQSDVTFALTQSGTNPIDVSVKRGDEKLNFTLTPAIDEGRCIIGFYPKYEAPSFKNVLHNAFFDTFFVIKLVVYSVKELITGGVSLSDMAGPVGIVSEMGKAAQYGLIEVFNLAALIAVNLGVMNMLPLPALDGGRALFALIELIIGRPVSPRLEGYIHTAGFMLLMLLMLVITFSDVTKLFR